MTAKFLLALFMLQLALPAWADKPLAPATVTGTTLVNAEQALELILVTPKLVIIDSRHAEEYAKGHIEGAINLLDTDTSATTLAKHINGKNTPILLYCSGERCLRSSNAATIAVNTGYRNVYWFRAGWTEWLEKKMPVAQ